MIKYQIGNLVDEIKTNRFDVLVHGCNCFSTMGAGVALYLRKAVPEIFDIDKSNPDTPNARLGKITYTVIQNNPVIVNAYTQFNFRGSGVLADYNAIKSAMTRIYNQFGGQRIAMPLIGAGLAGGDWTKIASIIEEVFDNQDVTVIILEREADSIYNQFGVTEDLSEYLHRNHISMFIAGDAGVHLEIMKDPHEEYHHYVTESKYNTRLPINLVTVNDFNVLEGLRGSKKFIPPIIKKTISTDDIF